MTAPSADRRPPAGIRRRGWLEVRWRQFRRAPRPVVRAVASSLSVALILGVAFLAYDIALDRGAVLPGGDLRVGFLAVVRRGRRRGRVRRDLADRAAAYRAPAPRRTTRTPWSAALGLFAAVPIAYLVLVVLHEIVKPLLVLA